MEEGADHSRVRRQIASIGSSGLTPTQQRYSTVEQELLSVLWAVQKTEYFIKYAENVKVFCDSKNVCDIFKMNLSDIKNDRILRMREKLLGYNLQLIHVKGKSNAIADRLSRFPDKKNKMVDIEDEVVPSISSRSLRLQSTNPTLEDPHVAKVAELGKSDSDYQYVIDFIKNKKDITKVDKESDLFIIQGEYSLLSIHNTQGGEVVLRSCKEVLIPRVYRDELKLSLHSTHLSDRTMLDLARGSFFWPKMSQDLRTLYKSCNECLTHSDSKPVESHNTIPDDLQ